MENKDIKELLSYIKSIIFDVNIIADIPHKFKNNNDLLEIDETIKNIRESVSSIGVGHLSHEIKGKGYLIVTLKKLQSSLKNLTWRTKCIAKGDFSRDLEYLGDFSDAFNNMSKTLETLIDDLKESKEHFELIFQTIPDPTIITSFDEGRVFNCNKAFVEFSGFNEEEIYSGNSHTIELYTDEKKRNSILAELNRTGFVTNMEIVFKNKNNISIIGLISSKTINIKGKTYILSVIKDITQLKELEEEIRKLSITDKLTQIYNRLKLDEILERKFLLSSRSNDPFSLIMVDIDHFKLVNDTFGHVVGDIVLLEFAKILKNNIRNTDVVGRWGGEEFLIILPKTAEEGSVLLAEKLRTIIEYYNFPKAGKITSSFGVASFKDDISVASLVSRADNALYKAKDSGRNKVEVM
ncbi:diguanylate cyclase (GGDEF)-like protein/PAS domain S-box-containing protein [Sedimentibacter acidaminivorans]|jgi:diguanylate cyclase (GGDEF)-like protein/PAS domain S-box-containing protein|uniref:Diguanylate cyclase (GGDEF)-like protein/PAS domain S-box-containing protein n=1 Tax=Sedimentibacter acidaminivorans TaxID=913099 RepID=A0ABS4GI45_9FIRM|nr:diguanylate cyclase [Sedimentibacter acidaminivorans]MBP1927370.1 diguanylate cyclase (GGDEF)-like protein/PAS domain S-box-containing protein [Sedimentibacter acidaminivorans]